MSSIYVFNTGLEPVSLYVNQAFAGEIGGVSEANGYAPSSAVYPFNPAGGNEGTEFGAQTEVNVIRPGGQFRGYQVSAPPVPPGEDIQLYLFASHAVLSWTVADAVLTGSAEVS
jgi:hypothetical protein